jgi:ribose 5-phosphate isomerase A
VENRVPSAEELKRAAAAEAVALVESGMRLGLGTGSTVAHFLTLLGERVRTGALTGIAGVPTSIRTAERCRELGIPLGELSELAPLDLAVDGADEVDPGLDVVKGLGGALLREKMVAAEARRFVVIVDGSKLVSRLGESRPIPVEVIPFAWECHLPFLAELGSRPALRRGHDGEPLRTDNGHFILDCRFPGGLPSPHAMEVRMRARAGVVATGLFLGMATDVLVAGSSVVQRLSREPGA